MALTDHCLASGHCHCVYCGFPARSRVRMTARMMTQSVRDAAGGRVPVCTVGGHVSHNALSSDKFTDCPDKTAMHTSNKGHVP
eukprot:3509406-Prymnesium_polylepis.1